MHRIGCVEGVVSEIALEFDGRIHCGDDGRGCTLLGPGRERLCIVSYFSDFWVVGCGLALPSVSSFCGRAVFATVSWRNFFPVVLLCQFSVLVRNSFGFIYLRTYSTIQLWCSPPPKNIERNILGYIGH